MPRNITLVAACVLALAFGTPGRGQDSPSLGDLARQAQKDKANKPAAKVLTNDDLPSGSSNGSAAHGAGFGQLGMSPAGSKPGTDPSPAEKLAMLEAFLTQVESMDRATLVHSVLEGKDNDFPGRAKWEERLVAAKEAYVAQTRDLIQKARQILAGADSLKGAQDPSDPRVKEMSARLQGLVRDAVRTDSALQAVIIEGRDLAGQSAAH
jgi:hypothetical protein